MQSLRYTNLWKAINTLIEIRPWLRSKVLGASKKQKHIFIFIFIVFGLILLATMYQDLKLVIKFQKMFGRPKNLLKNKKPLFWSFGLKQIQKQSNFFKKIQTIQKLSFFNGKLAIKKMQKFKIQTYLDKETVCYLI